MVSDENKMEIKSIFIQAYLILFWEDNVQHMI